MARGSTFTRVGRGVYGLAGRSHHAPGLDVDMKNS